MGLFDPHDRLHAKAASISKTLKGRQIVTSQIVLMEFLNHYASVGSLFRHRAVHVVRSLQQESDVTIIPQTGEQFEGALVLYSQREDKEWGLTDCASFLVMEEQGITEALAHDIHFRQAGFLSLLRDD